MLVLLVDFGAFVCIMTHLIYQSEMFLNHNRFLNVLIKMGSNEWRMSLSLVKMNGAWVSYAPTVYDLIYTMVLNKQIKYK